MINYKRQSLLLIITFIIGFIIVETVSPEVLSIESMIKTVEIKSESICKQKSDYVVDVLLNTVDVIVLDSEGEHISDLNKEDFVIWENGIKQDIATFSIFNHLRETELPEMSDDSKSESKTGMEVQQARPPRNFIIVFANLPFQEIKLRRIRQKLSELVQENLSGNDRVAIYYITTSTIDEIQPLMSDISETVKSLDSFFDGGGAYSDRMLTEQLPGGFDVKSDAPVASLGPMNPTAGASEFVMASDQNKMFQYFMSNLKDLIDSFIYIKGRKNIILFTEGIYSWTEFGDSKDVGGDDIVRFSVPMYLYSTLLAEKKVKNSLNRGNSSLYIIDIGSTSDYGIAGPVSRAKDSEISAATNERARVGSVRTLADLSGGEFYLHAGATDNRLDKTFKELNYKTSFYYNLSYSPKRKPVPGEYIRLRIDVLRDDVSVITREGITTPLTYKDMKEEERDQNLLSSLFSSLPYNDLSMCNDAAFFPTYQSNSMVLFSFELNAGEVVHMDGGNPVCDLDISGLASTSGNNVFNSLHKKLRFTLNKDLDLENSRIRYHEYMMLVPGPYKLRYFVRDRFTGKMVSNEQIINVPNVAPDSPFIGSILLEDEQEQIVTLSEYVPLPGRDEVVLNKDNPLVINNKIFNHSLTNEIQKYKKKTALVSVRGVSSHIPASLVNELLDWKVSPLNKDQDIILQTIDSEVLGVFQRMNGSVSILYELDFSKLNREDYRISLELKEKKFGNFLSSRIISIK